MSHLFAKPQQSNSPKIFNRARGFTIIELLIALALGLTLSGAITKIYIQNNVSMQQDEQIARL